MVTEQEQINRILQKQCSNESLCFENDPELTRGSWLVTALCIFILVLNTCIGLPSNIWALWKIAQSKKLSQRNFCIIQHLIASLVGCGFVSPAEAIHQGLIFMTDVPNHFLFVTSFFFQFLVNACIFSCTIYIAVERLQNIRNHFVKQNNFTVKKVILSILWILILPFAITGLYLRSVYNFKDSHFSCQFIQVSWIERLNCFIQILPFCLFTITLSTVVSIYIVCITELRKKTQIIRPSSNVTSVFSQPTSSMNENPELFHFTKYDTFTKESEGDESGHLPLKINAQVEPIPLLLSSSSTDYKISTGSSFSSTNPSSTTSSENAKTSKSNMNYQQAKNSAVTKMFTVKETTENHDSKIGFNPELDERMGNQKRIDSSDSFHFSQKLKKDEPAKVNRKKSKHVRTTSEESDYTLEKAFRKMSDISLASITTNTLPVEASNDPSDTHKAKYTLNPLRHTRRSAGNVWTLEPIPDFPNTENIWKLKPKIPHKLAPICFQKTSKIKKKKKRKTKMKKQISNSSIGTCSLTSNTASLKFTNSEMSEYSSNQSFGKRIGSDMIEPSIADSLITMESPNSQKINSDRETGDEITSVSDIFKTIMTTERDTLQKKLQPAGEEEFITQSKSSHLMSEEKITKKNQNNDSKTKSDAEKKKVQPHLVKTTVFNFDSDNEESISDRCKGKDGEVLDFEDVLSNINIADDETLVSRMQMEEIKTAKSMFHINMSTQSKMDNEDEIPFHEFLPAHIKIHQNDLEGRNFRIEKNQQYGEDFNLNTKTDAPSMTTKEVSIPKTEISSSASISDKKECLISETELPSAGVKNKNLKDFQCLWKPMPVIVSEGCAEDVFLNEEPKLNTVSKNDRLSDSFGAQDELKTVENLHVPHSKSTKDITFSSSSISSSYMLRPSKTKYSSTSTINSCFSRPMRLSSKISTVHDESSDGSVAFFKNSKSEDEVKFIQPYNYPNNYGHNVQFTCYNNSDLNVNETDLPTITESLSLQSYLNDKISQKKAIRERVDEWHCNSRPDSCMKSYGRLAKSLQDLRKIDRPSIFNIEESSLARIKRHMKNSTTQTEDEIITIKDLLMEQHYLDDNNMSHPIIRVIRPSLPSPKTIENQKKNDDHAKICQAIEEITEEGNVNNTHAQSHISKPSGSSDTIPKSVSLNQMYKPGKNPFTELNVSITLKRVLLILIPFTILLMPMHLEVFAIKANYLHLQNYIKISKCLLCIYYSCTSFIYVYSSKNLMRSLKVASQLEKQYS